MANSLFRGGELNSGSKSKKRKSSSIKADSEDGINGERTMKEIDVKKSAIPDTDKQIIKKNKRKRKEK